MKTTVHLPIGLDTHLLVTVGEKIDPHTPIFETRDERKKEIIPVSGTINIRPDKIFKYLKKRIGDKINLGDVLIAKKNIFSSFILKSPVSGFLEEVDLKKGTLTVTRCIEVKNKKFLIPTTGRVKSITKSHIEIELYGEEYKGEKGEGEETIGKLFPIEGKDIGILNIGAEVTERIVICKSLASDALVKLEVLDALGIILEKNPSQTNLTWITVNEENFDKLKACVSKNIWIRPKENQIIVLE